MNPDSSTDAAPRVIRDARGKRPQFYDTPGMDQVMSMIMVLANEVSVLRDRIDVSERVAAKSGLDLAAGIESFEFDEDALEEREMRRQDFLGRLFYLMRKEASEAKAAETGDAYRATIESIAKQ